MTLKSDITHSLKRIVSVPMRAYPSVVRHRLRCAWVAYSASDTPEDLSDEDLLRAFGASSINQLLTDFRKRGWPQFFLGDNPMERASQVAEESHGVEARLLAQADEIMDHRFNLLGSGVTDLGSIIPWRLDFISGHEWPMEHFSRLDIVDLDAGFDIKVPWELSRFHHATTLGQSYSLTGDEKYAREFVNQLADWWSENPAGFGPNWANAMEAAIRSTNWIWAYEFLCGSSALDDDFLVTFLKSMLQHARYIASHLESGWPRSNHLIADLCGLVGLGLFLSPAQESRLWISKGLRLLTREMNTQVLKDGADYEGSTSYHLFVAEMVLWTVAYCDINSVSVPEVIRQSLARMLDVISGLLRPDGNIPLFGDCDSGRWLVLESDRSSLPSLQDPRGVLGLAAVLFDRPDWADSLASSHPSSGRDYVSGVRWETALWSFGHRAVTLRTNLHPYSYNRQTSIAFPDAGWYVMRSGDNYMAITAGGNGTGGWGGHSHNDALSFELAVAERVFLVDPGSYAYTGDHRARNEFRSTAAHNTLRAGGQEMNRIPERDMFRLENDAHVRIHKWHDDEEHILMEAECICLAGRQGGYSHSRRFEYNRKFEFWLLTDTVHIRHRTAHGSCEIHFHFADLPLVLDGLTVSTVCSSGPNLALIPLGDTNGNMSVSLEKGWISYQYGLRVEAPIVRYGLVGEEISAARFALVPFVGCADLDHACSVLQHVQ